jgi:hypothetical protein
MNIMLKLENVTRPARGRNLHSGWAIRLWQDYSHEDDKSVDSPDQWQNLY